MSFGALISSALDDVDAGSRQSSAGDVVAQNRVFGSARRLDVQFGGASLMVKNCTLRTRWDRDDLRTDFQRTQFPASQTGILCPTVVASEVDVVPFQWR